MKSPTAFAPLLALSVLLAGCFEAGTLAASGGGDTARAAVDTLPVGLEEISVSNDDLLDEFGEDPGWIELANRSAAPVALGGFRLFGKASDGPGWMLPDTTLQPGERLVVFLSGRDIRTSAPAGETVQVAATAWVWSDSAYDPPGFSAVRGLAFGKKYSGKLPDGSTAYSFLLHLADNSETELLWSGATASLGFDKPVDASRQDRFRMRATLPAGQPLTMRLCPDDECWKAGFVTLTGTGDSLGVYEIPLSRFPIDLSHVRGLQFDPPANNLGDYRITLTDPGFYRSQRRPHANFKLGRKGGFVGLEDTLSKIREVVVYPAPTDAGSWARDPASGRWNHVSAGTPGRANPVHPGESILVAPAFATAPGFHASPLVVRVAGAASGTVRCAVGGLPPTASSPAADSGIRLDSSSAVTCAIFAPDGSQGPTATATYLLDETTDLPVVAVSVDPSAMFDPDTGICSMGPNASTVSPFFGANFWKETELPVHVELFEGGARSFALRAGLSMFGNWSRSADKKAFSIQMREKYGPTHVEWPLFPQHPELKRFKSFGLRSNGSNYKTDYQRDALASGLTEGRGIEYQYSRHAVLYIDGRYWGIYEIREKLDPDYLETRFGIDPANVDLIKNNSETQAGSIDDWNELRRTLQDLAADDDAGWEAMSKRIDLDNFMDYCAAELFAQNTDWPTNNNRYWRQRVPATPWRAMLFDLDGGIGGFGGSYTKNPFPYAVDSSTGWDDYPNGPGSNVVLRRILTRPALRDRFLNRFLVQLSTNLAPENSIRIMDSVTASIRSEIPRDVRRWNLSETDQTSHERIMRNFLLNRPTWVRTAMKSFFKLDSLQPISVSATGGTLRIDGMEVGASYAGSHFRSIPIVLEALGEGGAVFAGWSDGVATSRRVLTPGTPATELVAVFR